MPMSVSSYNSKFRRTTPRTARDDWRHPDDDRIEHRARAGERICVEIKVCVPEYSMDVSARRHRIDDFDAGRVDARLTHLVVDPRHERQPLIAVAPVRVERHQQQHAIGYCR